MSEGLREQRGARLLIISSSARRNGPRQRRREEHGSVRVRRRGHGSMREMPRPSRCRAEVKGEGRGVRGQLGEGEVHGERRPRHRRRGEHGAVPASVRLQRSTEFCKTPPKLFFLSRIGPRLNSFISYLKSVGLPEFI